MSAPPLKGRRLTCANKRRHPDEVTARAHALHCLQTYRNTEVLYPYRCTECGGWHLTRRKNGQAAVTEENVFKR